MPSDPVVPLPANPVTIEIVWDRFTELQPVLANQFQVQVVPSATNELSELVVNIGVLVPPPAFGDPAKVEELAASNAGEPLPVFVTPLQRLVMTKERAVELRDLLDRLVATFAPATEED